MRKVDILKENGKFEGTGKLTAEQVREIYYDDEHTWGELMSLYNVTRSTISNIKQRKAYHWAFIEEYP